MTDDSGLLHDGADWPLTQALRMASGASHDRIEAELDVGGRITSPEAYTALLAGFYGFYRPIEDALAALDWDGTGLDLENRRKAGLLAADLAACGHDPAALTLCRDVPWPADRAEGFGCLYVLEGATLGGKAIRQLLAPRLGDWLAGRNAFFMGYGPATGAQWRAFTRACDAFGESCSAAERQRALTAAVATFDSMRVWLRHQGVATAPAKA